MIEKLKFLIDECENSPKLKEILLKVASMPEDKQGVVLDLMEIVLRSELKK